MLPESEGRPCETNRQMLLERHLLDASKPCLDVDQNSCATLVGSFVDEFLEVLVI